MDIWCDKPPEYWGKIDSAMIITRLGKPASVVLCLLLLAVVEASPAYAQDSVQIKGPKNATDQFSGNVYGPITSDDTLWRIAERYRQNKSLSIYQVMVAIYDLNPDAFEQQNLNLMVDGTTLKLPSERFISRYDVEQAKARAQSDEQTWLRLTRSTNNASGAPATNIKPPSPPVNQEDLASTKSALEEQLKTLDATQAKQFDALREQFAQSITSVESLLQDNQKLYERIDKVNDDLDALRGQVDGDVRTTMNAQSQSIEEMLALLKAEQAQREEEASASFTEKLKDPILLTVLSALVSLMIIGGLGFILLRKKKSPNDETKSAVAGDVAASAASLSTGEDKPEESVEEPEDIGDDELFNDDDLLDDVLSSELEDSLDDELENFSDLSDEMLVPETNETQQQSDDTELFEEGDSQIAQDDLDSLFGDDDSDGFDISGEDEEANDDLLDELEQSAEDSFNEDGIDDEELADIASSAELDEQSQDLVDDALDDALNESIEELDSGSEDEVDPDAILDSIGAENNAVPDVEDESEISIDELLEAESPKPDIAEKLGVAGDQLDEDMLEKIDDEIKQQGQEIDAVADNIINEIEQLEMMGGMLDEMDDDDDIEVVEANADGIQDIDAIVEDIDEIEIDDMENADEFTDALSDDLIDELQETDTDALADELLDELSTDQESDIAEETLDAQQEQAETADNIDALADELLDELSTDQESDIAEDALEAQQEQVETDDDVDALADELLDELSTDLEPDTVEETPEAQQEQVDTDNDIDALADELIDELSADPLETQTDTEILDDSLTEEQNATDERHIEDIDEYTEDLISELDELDSFELESEQDGVQSPAELTDEDPLSVKDPKVVDELSEVPGIDDWLSEDATNSDTSILDELENTDFDELLNSIDDESSQQTVNEEPAAKLDNPDLDLNALFEEQPSSDAEPDDLISVDELLEDAEIADAPKVDEEFDLDVSLADFTGEMNDADLIDVDLDSGQAANLDLARAYIDMEDGAAARDLLLEVIEKGSEAQKAEAKTLLAELGDA